jgi:hypothetical protein
LRMQPEIYHASAALPGLLPSGLQHGNLRGALLPL